MKRKIPLAWLQLTREKTRLLVALGGIAFADILMFMQLGFKNALFDGNVRLHENLEGDIVLINPRSNALVLMKAFPQRRLYQALAIEEVKSVAPIYVEFGEWKNPQTGEIELVQTNKTEHKEMWFGYSGAEIEQAIVAAMYEAFAQDREFTQLDIIAAIKSTQPLSRTMIEQITALREWANRRARPAAYSVAEEIEREEKYRQLEF